MNDKIQIAVLIGTVRTGRQTEFPAQYVADFLSKQADVDVVLVDPRKLQLGDEGEEIKDANYSQITATADAFVIVTPEYNHGYPGSLKRMLDSEYANYFHKPVSLVGVSSGAWGGTRACEALLPVCHRLGLVNIRPELYFPNVTQMFDQSGILKPEFTDQYAKNTQVMATELLWFARTLKQARSQQT